MIKKIREVQLENTFEFLSSLGCQISLFFRSETMRANPVEFLVGKMLHQNRMHGDSDLGATPTAARYHLEIFTIQFVTGHPSPFGDVLSHV